MRDRSRGYALRVDILADSQRVWQAMIDAEPLARWCSADAVIRAQPGGHFRARVDRFAELDARIDLFEPARRLRLIHLPVPSLPPSDMPIVDDFILVGSGAATIVRLLGSGVPATAEWDEWLRRRQSGWRAAITRLKVLVERQSRLQVS